ncbi:MAG: VOC family protein [Turneriella sp.]|nr:VOC family protein [Leptospiraceae bacterium]MCX7632181.1 VOC family protein [Turneriella sp.]
MDILRTAFSLPVADCERTAKFYRAVFGAHRVAYEGGVVALELPGVQVFFMETEQFNLLLKPANAEAQFVRGTFSALLTATVPSRDAAYGVLKLAADAGGTPCGQAVPYSWGLAAYFLDPDSHLWEILWQSGKESV